MAERKDTDQPVDRRLRLGVVGIGVGASEILPQMEAMPDIQLVAAADINRRVLNTFQHRYGAKAYDSIEKLCADPNVEAVWISTPNRFHAPHTIIAVEHGKHVVVEKPMALSLTEAEKMIEAAEKNKVKLLCGHTQSYGPHIRTMRKIIRSGELGRLCALHVWAYTDWMLRPRTAEELDINQGGGVPTAKVLIRSTHCGCWAAAWCAVCEAASDSGSAADRSRDIIRRSWNSRTARRPRSCTTATAIF